ncbi:MAG TPA: flagellar basal body rod protein FlgB [Miltoncostaeaceae bacterium]|nr:flagellar basal body rod protein FlgB [Miltoncostaeaceae bacterium]
MTLQDVTAATLTSALRGYEARNQAIANNLANAETPGYRRLTVSFEQTLADAARAAHSTRPGTRADAASQVEDVLPATAADPTGGMRVDGSNVDPDAEMAALAQNQLAHQTVTSLLHKHFAQIRTAIIGR